VNRPEPQNELQRDLLRLVWDLFSATAQWPKFREVDRLFRRTGEDALRVAHSLPAGLMEPPVRHPGEHPPSWFTVTLAGMIACTEPAQLDRSLFLSALRVAAEIDDEWEGFPEEPEAIPVLNAKELVVRLADEYNWNQLPEDPDLLLRRVALLLNREPVGMRGAVGLGEPGWQLSIERSGTIVTSAIWIPTGRFAIAARRMSPSSTRRPVHQAPLLRTSRRPPS